MVVNCVIPLKPPLSIKVSFPLLSVFQSEPSASPLQVWPSIPTISTVPFRAPSFPASSHFPVTVTSARGLLAGVEVVLAGLVVVGGPAGAVVLPPQELIAIISPIKTIANITFLIIYFLLEFLVDCRGFFLPSRRYRDCPGSRLAVMKRKGLSPRSRLIFF